MKNKSWILLAALLANSVALSAQWKPAGDRIKTDWAEKIDVNNVLPEYPRPIMEREDWMNLNGLWNYSIAAKGAATPQTFEGEILVPFAVESSLSGVGKRLGENNELWYQRQFTVPSSWRSKRVLLHFGAVDWKTDVWVNDVKVGTHTGGFTPFSFDVTAALKKGENTLTVKVWDPTDRGPQPRGKQVNKPEGIWYTPVSGIWQTVWLEPVAQNYITGLKTTPDIDQHKLTLEVGSNDCSAIDMVEVKVMDGATQVAAASALPGVPVEVEMPADAKLWSPESPFLYDLEVSICAGGKVVDKVKSYAAMQKEIDEAIVKALPRKLFEEKFVVLTRRDKERMAREQHFKEMREKRAKERALAEAAAKAEGGETPAEAPEASGAEPQGAA